MAGIVSIVPIGSQAFDQYNGPKTITIDYLVVMTSATENETDLLTDGSCPQIGSVIQTYFYAIERRPSRHPLNLKYWYLTVTYTTSPPTSLDPTGGGGGMTGNDNPISRGYQFKVSSWREDVPLVYDYDPILPIRVQTKAGEDFDPPILDPWMRLRLTVTKARASYSLWDWATAGFSVNDSTFLGYFTENQCLLVDHNMESGNQNGTNYYMVTGVFDLKQEGHNPIRVKHQGFYQRYYDGSGDPEIQLIRDKWGMPTTKPVNLDSTGAAFTNPDDDPIFLEFTAYPEFDFSTLI